MKKRVILLLLAGIAACSDTANKQEPATQAPINKAPTVEAGADQVLPHGQMVTQLNGNYSDDGQSGQLSMQWQLTSGPTVVTILDSDKKNTQVSFIASGQYTFSLKVSDGTLSSSDQVSISVTENQAPSVNAGPDQVVNLGMASAQLKGSYTDDSPAANISVSWQFVSGPDTPTIIAPEASETQVQFNSAGSYLFAYSVSDGEFTETDTISVTAEANSDVFGITQLYDSATSQLSWHSQHWQNQRSRTVSSGPDPYDPQSWSEKRGNTSFLINGLGSLKTLDDGDQFRFYITPTTSNSSEPGFVNVETTLYYKRLDLAGPVNAGLVVGIRSGANGHSSSGDYCDANTYYARFRHDGNWDLYKELKHPKGTIGKSGELSDTGQLPTNQWLGMKFVAYNNHDNSQVKLELYIDDSSNGDIKNGGQWRKLAEIIDDGAWIAPPENFDCDYPANKIITQGGGTVLIRNTSSKAEYRYLSIREIAKPSH